MNHATIWQLDRLVRALLLFEAICLAIHAYLATQYELGTTKFIAPLCAAALSIAFAVAAIRARSVGRIALAGIGLLVVFVSFPPRQSDFGEYFLTMRSLVWTEIALCLAMVLCGMAMLIKEYRANRVNAPTPAMSAQRVRDTLVLGGALAVLGFLPLVVSFLAQIEVVDLPERLHNGLRPLTLVFFLVEVPLLLVLRSRRSRLAMYPILGAAVPLLVLAPFVYSMPVSTVAAISEATSRLGVVAIAFSPYGAVSCFLFGLISRATPPRPT